MTPKTPTVALVFTREGNSYVTLWVDPSIALQLKRGDKVTVTLSSELSVASADPGAPESSDDPPSSELPGETVSSGVYRSPVGASPGSSDVPSSAPQVPTTAGPAAPAPAISGSPATGAAPREGSETGSPAGLTSETNAERARRQAREQRDSETPEQQAARRAAHHPDWRRCYKGFAARLGALEMGADIDTISAWLESLPKPAARPSQRSEAELEALIAKLETNERTRALYMDWAVAPAAVPCERCGLPVVRYGGKVCNPEVVRATTKAGRSQGGRVVLVLDDGSERTAVRDHDGEISGRVDHRGTCALAVARKEAS